MYHQGMCRTGRKSCIGCGVQLPRKAISISTAEGFAPALKWKFYDYEMAVCRSD